MDVSVRAAARRASLIELGRRAFAERSYDEVTTQFLAESGGMSMGLLYRYFGDKRGFYLACLQDAAGELLSLLHFESFDVFDTRQFRGPPPPLPGYYLEPALNETTPHEDRL